jgi:hypothetical protein
MLTCLRLPPSAVYVKVAADLYRIFVPSEPVALTAVPEQAAASAPAERRGEDEAQQGKREAPRNEARQPQDYERLQGGSGALHQESDWGGSRHTFLKVAPAAAATATTPDDAVVIAEQPTELIQRSDGRRPSSSRPAVEGAGTDDQGKSRRPPPETLMFCPLCVDTVLPGSFSTHFATVRDDTIHCLFVA